MKTKTPLTVLLLAMLFTLTTGAWAGDALQTNVTAVSQLSQNPPNVIGSGSTSGVIQLLYTYIGYSFPCGQFATFNLGFQVVTGPPQSPTYPSPLVLADSGKASFVQLAPAPSGLSVLNNSWSGSSSVTVNINNCGGLPNTDGSEIDGTMLMINNQSNLSAFSSVQVLIKLVFPNPAGCLKLYSFESNQGTLDLLTSLTVVADKKGLVKSTNPGEISADALVVNTCPTPQTFDLGENLGQFWRTNPYNNPGNAVFTFTTAGEVDPGDYNFADWGQGTKQGESLCIQNFTLQSQDSLLMRVHSKIINGSLVSDLPKSPSEFPFVTGLYTGGSSCGTPLSSGLVTPNPATSAVSYTVK
jgi:hypothetical protein